MSGFVSADASAINFLVIILGDIFCFPYLCLHLDVESTDVKSEPASPEEDATRTHFGNGLK